MWLEKSKVESFDVIDTIKFSRQSRRILSRSCGNLISSGAVSNVRSATLHCF